ncbi:MAG: metallophosphoesterase [Nitrospirae bacterium]|nr:metallophosphoesterase [Nitrospirota bacterium]
MRIASFRLITSAGLGAAVSILTPFVAWGAISKGPYLQSVNSSSVVVVVESGASSATVNYGLDTLYGKSATASDVSNNDVIEVGLAGLAPSSLYHYKVTTSSGDASSDLTFFTAPASGESFSFVVYGDNRKGTIFESGGSNSDHQKVVDAIVGQSPDFLVNSADFVATGTSSGDWQNFFDIERTLIGKSPLFPTMGNHDTGSLYGKFFVTPTAASGTEDWYSFNYGNAHFVSVNTEQNFASGGSQYAFLNNDLAASAGKGPLFVFFHKPPFSSGYHGEDSGVKQDLVPLFQKHGVDLVFNGHDHNYERTKSINGVTYVVSGGGGAPLRDVGLCSYSVTSRKTLNHLYVQVSGNVVTAKAYQPDGTTIDSFSVDATSNDGMFNSGDPLPACGSGGGGGGGGCTQVGFGSTGGSMAGSMVGLILLAGFLARRRIG